MSGPQSVSGLAEDSSRPSIGTTTPTRRPSRARRKCCGASGRVSVALTTSALPRRADVCANRRTVVDFLGESIIVTADGAGSLHAFANVCDTGVRRSCRSSRAPRLSPVTRNRCAVRTIPGPTVLTAGCCMLRTPRMSISTPRPSDFSACAPRPGADSFGSPRIWRRLLSIDALAPVPDRVRRYPLDTLVVGMRLNYSVAANWKVLAENYNECYHCGPVHPELSRLVPAFAGGGADLAVGGRHPTPRGRMDIHPVRHDRPCAVPGPRRRRTGTAQGRVGLPEPAPVAVGRTRRGVRPATHRGRSHRDHVRSALRSRRGRETGIRPE